MLTMSRLPILSKTVMGYFEACSSIMILEFVSRGVDIGRVVGFCGVIALRHLSDVHRTSH
jgi:hypothetical protein